MCKICAHKQVADMESALEAGKPAREVAGHYRVKAEDLAAHRDVCMPYLRDVEGAAAGGGMRKPGSLQRSLNMAEGNVLAKVFWDAFSTFRKSTKAIDGAFGKMGDPEGVKAAGMTLRKPVLDHHVQLIGEMRQIARTLAEMDKQYSNAAETQGTPLGALTGALSAALGEAPGGAAGSKQWA